MEDAAAAANGPSGQLEDQTGRPARSDSGSEPLYQPHQAQLPQRECHRPLYFAIFNRTFQPENSPGPSKLQKHKAKGSRAVSFPVNVKRFKLRKPMTTRKLGSRAGNSLQLVAKRNFAWQTKSDNIQSNLTLEKSSVFSVEFQVQNEDKKSMSKESLEELLAGRCSSDMD